MVPPVEEAEAAAMVGRGQPRRKVGEKRRPWGWRGGGEDGASSRQGGWQKGGLSPVTHVPPSPPRPPPPALIGRIFFRLRLRTPRSSPSGGDGGTEAYSRF